MDVVASAQAAAALAGMFLEIVKITKHIIEAMKGARAALVEIFTRAERIRLNLELFRSLTNRISDPMEKAAALSFNESAYRQTANEVIELVHKVASLAKRHNFVMKVNWLFYRSEVVALVKKLEEREKDLGLVLTFISAQSSVITESEVLVLRTKVEEQTEVSYTFGDIQQEEDTQIAPATDDSHREQQQTEELNDVIRPRAGWPNMIPNPSQMPPTLWLGVLIRESFSPAYLSQRDELAHASYWGDWTSVLECLNEGKKVFNEAWPNAVRLGKTNNYHELSLWTPLHQAAYMRAPVGVISQLIEHGAFRTLPTGKTDSQFQFPDLTASEIARELGYDDLYNILAPVIKHALPATTLTLLQENLHQLLWAELEYCGPLPLEGICLPPLTILTELERPEIWFPLDLFQKAFLCRLDGRELVVLSLGRRRWPSKQAFLVLRLKGGQQFTMPLS